MRFMVLTLRGPMMSFGGAIIDGAGNTGRLPALSALSGLLSNALGFDRTEADRLNRLQGDIVYAAREDCPGRLENDFQTAQISRYDRAWTPNGVDERSGSAASYKSPVLLERQYLADHAVTVVIGFRRAEHDIEDIVAAIEKPARPIFLGRKAFLPSMPLIDRSRPVIIEADDAYAAIRSLPPIEGGKTEDLLACWPDGQGEGRRREVRDIRDFIGNRHAGSRFHKEGRISVVAA